MRSPKDLLSQVPLYVGLQKAVGSDLLRYGCIDAARIRPGETVVDVGCGPAYYFGRFPSGITYHGYDTDAGYIDYARAKYGDHGQFHLGIFDASAAEEIPAPDVILMLGLLHHLDDETARALLDLCSDVLAPGGRVVSADPTFTPDQGKVSKWMSENDRGEHVRDPEILSALATPRFHRVDAEIVPAHGRILGTNLRMVMHKAPAGVTAPAAT